MIKAPILYLCAILPLGFLQWSKGARVESRNIGLLRTWKFQSPASQRQSARVCPTEDTKKESQTHVKTLLLVALTVSELFEAFTLTAGTGAGKSQYLSEAGGHVCQAVYATCHKAKSRHFRGILCWAHEHLPHKASLLRETQTAKSQGSSKQTVS